MAKRIENLYLEVLMVSSMGNIILDIGKILENMKFEPSDAKIYSLLLEKGEMR